MHAILALGFSGSERAVTPLLKMAAMEFPDDKRNILSRVLCTALYQSSPYKNDKGLLAGEGRIAVPPELLVPAFKKLLTCPGGQERSMLSKPVLARSTKRQRRRFLMPFILTG